MREKVFITNKQWIFPVINGVGFSADFSNKKKSKKTLDSLEP